MSELPDGYTPIPDWPGYYVNRLGQVCSEYGDLTCDSRGKYTLRHRSSKKQKKLHVGAIMELAGLLVSADSGQSQEDDEMAALRRECDALRAVEAELRTHLTIAEQTIARGRKLNGHLLHLVRGGQQDSEPDRYRKKTSRHTSRARQAAQDQPEPLDLDEWDM